MLGGVNWVGVFADDVETLAAFYRDVLGLKQVWRQDESALFALPGGALLELVHGGKALGRPGQKSYDQQSVQIGLAVPNLEAACADLAARGVPIGEVKTYEDWRWAHVLDPEGNALQLVQAGSPLGQS